MKDHFRRFPISHAGESREDNRKKLTFIDLFAGCGGFSEGFLSSGKFTGLAHIEWEKPMVETLRYRLKSNYNHTSEDALRRVIHFDLQRPYGKDEEADAGQPAFQQ